MVAQRMGSQGIGSNSTMGTHTRDPKPNPLSRQGSLYNLTLDEVQVQLGDLGKPLISMNIDELLKSVSTAEENNQTIGGVNTGPTSNQPALPLSGLNRQSSLTFAGDLSKKTVDEAWHDIQQDQERSSIDRKATLGEFTLEDFLVKAGVVAESAPETGKKSSGLILGGVDSMGLIPQTQWMNYQIPSIPVYAQGHPDQQPIPLCGNTMMDAIYSENLMSLSSMGTLSDTQTPGRKRVASVEIVEKTVERRQKRMIKNRESAARSRARKQAYTHELENKVSRLEEENEKLKRQKELEQTLPYVPPPQPKYQLRRTSSAPI